MPTAPTPITGYGTPPSSADPANFDARADAKVAADVVFVTEANALGANVYANALEAATSATSAATAKTAAEAAQAAAVANAAAAAGSAGAAPWASGSYNAGVSARSTVNYRIYVARTTGAKPTDPSADPTNWGLSVSNDLQDIPVTGTTHTAAVAERSWLKNAAATTLTAPPTPVAGDTFGVKVANGRFDNLINWNGAKHEGLSDTTMTLNGGYLSLRFVYIDATYGWGIV